MEIRLSSESDTFALTFHFCQKKKNLEGSQDAQDLTFLPTFPNGCSSKSDAFFSPLHHAVAPTQVARSDSIITSNPCHSLRGQAPGRTAWTLAVGEQTLPVASKEAAGTCKPGLVCKTSPSPGRRSWVQLGAEPGGWCQGQGGSQGGSSGFDYTSPVAQP